MPPCEHALRVLNRRRLLPRLRCGLPPNPRMQPTGGAGKGSSWARRSPQPSSGSVNCAGADPEGLQLMRMSLGRLSGLVESSG